MSASPTGKSAGYTPVPSRQTRFTIADFRELSGIYKELVDKSGVKWSIVAVGIAAIAETCHIVWLAARFLWPYLQHK